MAGPVKTEGVVLRSLRYGEADRILHLYTPQRGKVGAIAKGVRRARSRFGGRLEPFFRLEPRPARGPQRPAHGHRAPRRSTGTRGCARTARALDTAARACDAVARLFDTAEPHPERLQPALQRARAARRRARRAPAHANQLAFRLKLLLAAGLAPQLAACASCGEREHLSGFSGAAGGVVCPACEAGSFPLDEEAHAFLVDAHRPAAGRDAGGRRARAAPGRARDRRDASSTTRGIRWRQAARPDRIAGSGGDEMGLRVLRGLAGHARPARRQGRQRRGDDAHPRARARAGGLHDHHRGVRRLHARRTAFPDGLDEQVDEALAALEEQRGQEARRRRGPAAGLGALGRARVDAGHARHRPEPRAQRRVGRRGWRRRPSNERFAWDSYRRFVQMFGNVVRGIEGERFEDEIKRVKADRGVKDDTELDVEALRSSRARFKGFYEFPTDPREQLEQAIRAVFDSWNGERAVDLPAHQPHPRRLGHGGQRPADGLRQQGRHVSGSGVAFSRDEVTGAPEPSGDFLVNAQGEDVVSGVRNTLDISELERRAARGPRAADGDPARRSSATTATCRTPSSRSRRASCTCCRRATPSARRRRRCASRSTRWTRGCSTRRRRCRRSTPRRSTRCCTRPSTRRPSTTCSPRAWPPRRARRRARSSSPPPTRWRRPPTGAT